MNINWESDYSNRLSALTRPLIWPDADLCQAVRALKVDHLKKILQSLSLSTTGLKQSLIERIISRLDYAFSHDRASFEPAVHAVRVVASNPQHFRYPNSAYGYSPPAAAATGPMAYHKGAITPLSRLAIQSGGGPARSQSKIGHLGSAPAVLKFQPSPFYEILRVLAPPRLVQGRKDHFSVNSIIVEFHLAPGELQEITKAGFKRIALFCTTADVTAAERQLVYPKYPPVVNVNGFQLKTAQSDFMPARNKPWSSKPMDLTDGLFGNFPALAAKNRIEIRWQQSGPQKHYVMIALLQKFSARAIVERYQRQQFMSKAAVEELQFRKPQPEHHDDEAELQIEQSDMTVSLKDPLTLARIKVPMRSKTCTHVQCFDAEAFFMFNDQSPTRLCSVCSKLLSWNELFVDGYFKDLLEHVPDSCDAVVMHPDGTYDIPEASAGSESDSMDNLKEIDGAKTKVELSLSEGDDVDVVIVSSASNRSSAVDIIELSDSDDGSTEPETLNSRNSISQSNSNNWSNNSSRNNSDTDSIPLREILNNSIGNNSIDNNLIGQDLIGNNSIDNQLTNSQSSNNQLINNQSINNQSNNNQSNNNQSLPNFDDFLINQNLQITNKTLQSSVQNGNFGNSTNQTLTHQNQQMIEPDFDNLHSAPFFDDDVLESELRGLCSNQHQNNYPNQSSSQIATGESLSQSSAPATATRTAPEVSHLNYDAMRVALQNQSRSTQQGNEASALHNAVRPGIAGSQSAFLNRTVPVIVNSELFPILAAQGILPTIPPPALSSPPAPVPLIASPKAARTDALPAANAAEAGMSADAMTLLGRLLKTPSLRQTDSASGTTASSLRFDSRTRNTPPTPILAPANPNSGAAVTAPVQNGSAYISDNHDASNDDFVH